MKPNIVNRTVFEGDNLVVLRGMNSGSVDLIYLDPPFNSNRAYSAPIGSRAAGAAFKDAWTLDDEDEAWHGEIADQNQAVYDIVQSARTAHSKGMKSYLIMMAVRLLEMHRVLKETGSIYLHCDPTASHYLKMLMDAIFGTKNFLNEIVWHYKSFHGNVKRYFPKKHDLILVYKKSQRWTFNRLFDDDNTGTIDYTRWQDFLVDGKRILGKNMPDHDSRFVRFLDRWKRENGGKSPGPNDVVYEVVGQALDTVWNIKPVDPKDKTERTGYPTQKPLELLERIIKASTNEGDMVLDPFCGCATALVAAENLGRQWIGIDLSDMAVQLVRQRLQERARVDAGAKGQIPMAIKGKVLPRKARPIRTDQGKLKRYNSKENKDTLYGRQQGECNGCGKHFEYRNMEVDHMEPQSLGGSDHLDNLQLLCGHCNRVKGQRPQKHLKARLKEMGII